LIVIGFPTKPLIKNTNQTPTKKGFTQPYPKLEAAEADL
jgi:hypothetical protein